MGKKYLVFLLFLSSCATISGFDQYSYTQTTSVKIDVLKLMDKSNEPYTNHLKNIEEVNTKLLKNIEYEKHRPKNMITISMYNILWKLINDTTTIHGAGVDFKHGFFPEWQKQDSIKSKSFITEAENQVAEGFDLIAELESKKIKQSDEGISRFLSKNK